VNECIKLLKTMGYGLGDSNELARLTVCASAAAGNVEEAIELIEEDRRAALELAEKDADQVGRLTRAEEGRIHG